MVAVNIAVTAFVAIIVMEVDENATGPSKNLVTLLKCDNPLNSKTERLREWFDTLDQQKYLLGDMQYQFLGLLISTYHACLICNVSISEPCLKVLLCPVCCPTSSAALFSSFTISAGELDTNSSNLHMCHVFSFLDLIMYVDYSWLLPYIQSQFVLFPSHPWRKLVKGTCSQLRDPMEPLEGETPYWEEV